MFIRFDRIHECHERDGQKDGRTDGRTDIARWHRPRNALHRTAKISVSFPSVCVSVTFVDSVKTSNRIFEVFSSSGSQIILVVAHQMLWQ